MSDTKIAVNSYQSTQPKSILKKASKRIVSQSPMFSLDNELFMDIPDTEPIKSNRYDNFSPEPYHCLHGSYNEIPENSYLAEILKREENRPKPSSTNSNQSISNLVSNNKNKRRAMSDVYILHYTEINKQIIKMQLKSIDDFLDEFKEKVGCEKLSDLELMKTHRAGLIKEILNFLQSDEMDSFFEAINKQQHQNQDLGFGLSEPNILEIKKLQRLNYKEKIHIAKSSASIAKTGLNEPAIYGSLPAASRLAKITKDLESKRVPVKSFNIESKKKTVSSARTTKKIVRFADSFGFDLEKVQFIGKNSFSEIFSPSTQNIPNIEEEDSDKINENKPFMVLLPLFSLQKSTQVTDIKLESYVYDYENKMIRCMVKVHNISFHKRVFARITLNQWKSHYDLNAVYVKSESQKTKNTWNDSYQNVSFDFFGFCLIIPDKSNTSYKNPQEKSLVDDSTIRIEFALGFETDNQSHWDNNFGQNYKFQLFYNI